MQKTVMNVRTLRYRVDGSCGCQCECYIPFRDVETLDKLMKVHKTLGMLDKVEQDKYAFPSAKSLHSILYCNSFVFL